MGDITKEHPKCMTEISGKETILSRQLKLLDQAGIQDVVITTGLFDEILVKYCQDLGLGLDIQFVKNPIYDSTNYIYSIYLAKTYLEDDILLMHGDLVFEREVLQSVLEFPSSCMTISTTLPLPEKDFKAVVAENRIQKIGIEYFDHAYAAQPLYKLCKSDWEVWLRQIERFCESGNRCCYAEKAFNEISDQCLIYPLDVKDQLCNEIDTKEDLESVRQKMEGKN